MGADIDRDDMIGLSKNWARRIVVLSLYIGLLLALSILILPLLAIATVLDIVRSQPWTIVRTLVFFLWYLSCELIGVLASLVIWSTSGPWLGRGDETFLRRNYQLQRWWARMLGRGAFRIMSIRLVEHDQTQGLGDRPVIVFVRHASTADTILAALLLSIPHQLRLRYVLKRELLWDPCLDIVGNRIPNVFVRRNSSDTAGETAAVARLAASMSAGDGVLIYPEGTRFSPEKKARIVARLREQGREDAATEAEALRHVLLPRPGGYLALLEAAPDADAVFLAHTGFEGSASFDRFFNGGLIGKTVHTQLRTVPAGEIPRSDEERKEWMLQQWRMVDEFIEQHQDPDRPLDRRRGGQQRA